MLPEIRDYILGRIKEARGPGHWGGARPLFLLFRIDIQYDQSGLLQKMTAYFSILKSQKYAQEFF